MFGGAGWCVSVLNYRQFLLLSVYLLQGLLVSGVRPQTGGTDCHGKDYLCLDDVRFQLCVDYGDGKPTTVNDEVQLCPAGTFCSNSGQFECDSFVALSTTAEPHVNVEVEGKWRAYNLAQKKPFD